MELAKVFAKVVAKILSTSYPFHSRRLIFQCKLLPAIPSGDVRLKFFNKFLIENYLKLSHPMIDDAATGRFFPNAVPNFLLLDFVIRIKPMHPQIY